MQRYLLHYGNQRKSQKEANPQREVFRYLNYQPSNSDRKMSLRHILQSREIHLRDRSSDSVVHNCTRFSHILFGWQRHKSVITSRAINGALCPFSRFAFSKYEAHTCTSNEIKGKKEKSRQRTHYAFLLYQTCASFYYFLRKRTNGRERSKKRTNK